MDRLQDIQKILTDLKITLCGTKLLARADYERIIQWRRAFGDFDPFGDFELLFAAKIQRFRHGLILFKMTAIGLLGLKPGRARC